MPEAKCANLSYNGFQFGDAGYPVPNVTLSTTVERFDNEGPVTRLVETYTLDGKIYNSGGVYTALINKAKALRDAFRSDGSLIIEGLVTGTARVSSFDFKPTENYWTQTLDYSIGLTRYISGNCPSSGNLVDSYNNSWQVQPSEELYYYSHSGGMSGFTAYRVTHTISAVGKVLGTGSGCSTISGYTNEKFKNAVEFVRLNFDLNALVKNGSYYDFARTIDANTAEGSYSVTDTFTYLTGNGPNRSYNDSCTIEAQTDLEGTRTVTVQGSIKGFGLASGTPSAPISFSHPYALSGTGTALPPDTGNNRFAQALVGWGVVEPMLYARASNISGYVPSGCATFYGAGSSSAQGGSNKGQITLYLNPRPVSTTVGYDPAQGEITYNYSYNNRAANLLDCSLSESLIVNDTMPSQSIAEVFVLGRKLGPVLQNLGTYSSPNRKVTFDVTLPKASALSGITFPQPVYKQITGIIELFNPRYMNTTIKSFVTEDSETWDPNGGKFSKSKTWIYTKCEGNLDDLTNPNVK